MTNHLYSTFSTNYLVFASKNIIMIVIIITWILNKGKVNLGATRAVGKCIVTKQK